VKRDVGLVVTPWCEVPERVPANFEVPAATPRAAYSTVKSIVVLCSLPARTVISDLPVCLR
jgi:hypothetical protein